MVWVGLVFDIFSVLFVHGRPWRFRIQADHRRDGRIRVLVIFLIKSPSQRTHSTVPAVIYSLLWIQLRAETSAWSYSSVVRLSPSVNISVTDSFTRFNYFITRGRQIFRSTLFGEICLNYVRFVVPDLGGFCRRMCLDRAVRNANIARRWVVQNVLDLCRLVRFLFTTSTTVVRFAQITDRLLVVLYEFIKQTTDRNTDQNLI